MRETEPQSELENVSVTLSDLITMLWRRKWLILVIGSISVAVCVAYAVMREHQHQYTTLVEIGSFPETASSAVMTQIQSSEVARQKLIDIYIPLELNRAAEALGQFKVSLGHDDRGGVITLRSVAPPGQFQGIRDLPHPYR